MYMKTHITNGGRAKKKLSEAIQCDVHTYTLVKLLLFFCRRTNAQVFRDF